MRELGKRKTQHDKEIKRLRREGVLKPLGTVTNIKPIKPKLEKTIAYLTENGSLMPNKWASWNYPFNRIIDKDL